MNVKALTSALLVALVARSFAETIPSPGPSDSRIRVAPYSQDAVYRLSGYVGFETDVEFEPGERFVGLGAGDIEGLSFVAEGNHLFLKPKAATVATNLTLLTTRRTYQVDYSAHAAHPEGSDEVTYVLRFTYPPLPESLAGGATRSLGAGSERPKNLDYWFCGDPSLKPVAASDDGLHTRLTFAARAEQPAIFVLNDDGTESLLNFSLEEGDVILHRVARRLILRRGHLAGCIVNQGFSGVGPRPKSHTVSPEVERLVPGARP